MRYALLVLAVVGLFMLAGCQQATQPTAPAQNTGGQGAPASPPSQPSTSPTTGQPTAANPGITVSNSSNSSLGVNVNPSNYQY